MEGSESIDGGGSSHEPSSGLTGVFKTLTLEHRDVETMLSHVDSTMDPGQRKGLWSEIRRQLLSHERGELEAVYSVLEAREPIADDTRRATDDARRLGALVAELDAVGPHSPEFRPAFARLKAVVLKHAEEEEHDLFPRAAALLGRDECERLNARYGEARERALADIG
jgi:hemerythrin superfamily protein